MSARDWRLRAGCVDADAELFFSVAVSGLVLERQVAEAKAVCGGCAVRAECLADALVMWISARKRRIEQGIQVGDMSVTWPWPVPVVVPGAGR